VSRSLLHRYWFRFDVAPFDRLKLGAGVTAFTKDDALKLLRDELAPDTLPAVADVIEDVRPDQLDKSHVVPNMHPMSERGVWFPKLKAFS